MNETWKSVPGWPYEVSNAGHVRRTTSNPGTFAGRLLNPTVNHDGYLRLRLRDNGRARTVFVHVLVAEVFIGERPAGATVNHRDHDKTNNGEQNLEYLTHRENCIHAYQGRSIMPKGEAHVGAKLTEAAVVEIRAIYTAEREVELASRFGVSRTAIRLAAKRKSWKHV